MTLINLSTPRKDLKVDRCITALYLKCSYITLEEKIIAPMTADFWKYNALYVKQSVQLLYTRN